MRTSFFRSACLGFCFLVVMNAHSQTACVITCPGNITVASTSASGAIVNYSAPTSSGDCGVITSIPASGSTFPIGTTTVNVYNNASQLIYGLLGNKLFTFSINNPSVVSSPLTITGLQTGESIRSIDFRPANGQLYGMGATSSGATNLGRLYTINITTGAATQVGSGTFPLPSETFATSLNVSIDFDPVTDLIRLVSDEDLNMRIAPGTGAFTTDGPFDPSGRQISGIAYSNNIPFASSTTLYDLGFGDPPPFIIFRPSVLYIQDPDGSLAQVGTTGLPSLFHNIGFDISQTGTALASSARVISVGGQFQNIPSLYSINLATGQATLLGDIGISVEDISIAPANQSEPSCSFTITVTPPPPTVTINKAASQFDPTTGTLVRFTVVFNEEVTGFDASDISFAGSTVTGSLVATVTGTGPAYGVSVSGITGVGNVVASVVAGAAVNSEAVLCLASTSTDNVVAVITIPHELFITKTALRPNVVAGGLITYEVTVGRSSIPFGLTVHNVTVTDVLPSGTSFINFQPVAGNSVPPIVILPSANNGTLGLVFPIFNPGNFFTFRIIVGVHAGVTGSISNTATVGGPLGDVNLANNSATALVQIAIPPTINCPGNIVVDPAAGECSTLVSLTGENAVTVTGTPAPTFSYTINFGNGSTITRVDETSFPESLEFFVGVNTIQIIAANDAGSASCSFTVTLADNQPPIITCPSDITVNAQAGQCSADVIYGLSGSDACPNSQSAVTVQVSTGITTTFQGAAANSFSTTQTKNFPVGTTTVHVLATDAAGNTATCSFNVTVVDNEKPVITTCPGAVTVSCTSQIPIADISAVTASDNCGATTITHVGDVITNQICANKYTLTRTYKATDGSGNTATCSQIINIDDNTPPQITGLTPSKRILAPPNHKMVNVTLDYIISDNCSSTPSVSITISSNEPVNGTGDGDTDPDWEVIDDHHIKLRAERAAHGSGRIYTITVTADDGCNDPVSSTTEVVVAHNITGPHSGNSFKVGSTVAFTGEFWDVPGSKHSAKWLIDGSTTAKAVVTEPAGSKNGKVTGSYKFTTPGVYKLQMNITDQNGVTTYANTNGDLEAIVVIYDPNGGHTYGGGYYNSPAGALVDDPSSTGKASYGFAMNYFKNSTNPKGETQFEFKVGDFEFNALNFDYLVISNSMAQFKGTGKIIGGQSGIGFTMTVTDGQLDGTGVDKIRMKIYNRNNGKIIYDNQPGASDAALPTQAVGPNSTIVISGINSILTSANTNQKGEMEASLTEVSNALDVIAFPNPSASNFTIAVKAKSAKEKIAMQVVDVYGRVVETRNVNSNSLIRFGDRYTPGTYFVRILQGKGHKEIKLIKLSD